MGHDPKATGTDATWDWADQLQVPSQFEDSISIALRELIGKLQPGEKLPNERDIALQFGVSRNALRDRIRLLEAVGIVSRRQGSGTYVETTNNPAGLAFALEMLVSSGQMKLVDLHQVRIGLERQAAILAADGAATAESVQEMRAHLASMDEHYGAPEATAADIRFHRTLMLSSGNPALSFFADALQSILARATELGAVSWQQQQIGRSVLGALHEDIVLAIEAHDPRAAAQAVDDHFRMQSLVIAGAFG